MSELAGKAASPMDAASVDTPQEARLADELRPGDWVQIYAQISRAERVHPEDVAVEMFSHNEQYLANVRRDRVQRTLPPIGVAYRCTALYKTPRASNDVLIRCRLHDRHADDHQAVDGGGAPWRWADSATVGNVEDRT